MSRGSARYHDSFDVSSIATSARTSDIGYINDGKLAHPSVHPVGRANAAERAQISYLTNYRDDFAPMTHVRSK
jgi:predicted type IV restriction endonuclease